MLENSFVHLPGVSPQVEQRIWSLGLRNWDDLEGNVCEFFNVKRAQKILGALEESRAAKDSGEFSYFQERFKGAEMWRILPSLLESSDCDKVAYLDIETTGLGGPPASHSTSIAVLFDGELFLEYDHEKKRQLVERLDHEAKCFVTFNGLTFDLPFLRKEFDARLLQPHVDLRFWFARQGIKGGLKKIQLAFPEVRQRESFDIDGYDAVKLWRMHEWGVQRAIETLMTYNAEDTVVLKQLMYCGLNKEAELMPHLRLPSYDLPECPKIPTEVCTEVYRLLRNQVW